MDRAVRWGVPALSVALVVIISLLVVTITRPTLPSSLARAADSDTQQGITVVGQGMVKVKPDVAHINLSVVTTAQTAQEASAQNATQMTQVIDKLTALGIKKDDIQTVGLTIYPLMDKDPKDPNNMQITGYRAQNSVMVTVDVDKAGEVFDAGVASGANQSSNISFGLRDDTQYRQQALAAAVKSARQDADTIAKAMNLTITGVKSVEVQSGGSTVDARQSAPMTAAAGSAPTPVNPGELTITAQVQVVYGY